ncbi:threonine/serine exporter ThrE family protein [Agromyces sp. LHK192]|uniref:threonine/serine ThrE exporter family protein n=1 Tax=Agromyces sp. LHK192 TaxID=2498704 RepID=UPI000FDBB15F|nr:threonine/serine exporter family protein [Agromyces sp. LHK192]
MADSNDDAMLRQFLLGLAEGLNAAQESVDRIGERLAEIAAAYDRRDIQFVVLPTMIIVDSGAGQGGRVGLRTAVNPQFRLDQIAALYELVALARAGSVDPERGIERLNQIGAMRPRHRWQVRVLGHAILTTGLALLLTPTWQGLLVAFGLGAVLGLAKLIRSPTLQLVFPVVAAFVSAITVFLLSEVVPIGNPLELLIAPLVTFLPGSALTTATMELAAGQMIAGASRLITGLVQLALLSFGILAAGTVVGVGAWSYEVLGGSGDQLPWWTAAAGVLLIAVGDLLHFSAPGRAFGWVLLALVVAYFGQAIGELIAGATVSGFVGALAMTPVVLWISDLRRGVPSQLTFLPAFWLLVPGAAGVAGLTEAFGTESGVGDFVTALTSIMAIALGVLIGTALYRVVHRGAEELANFHIELPSADDEAAEPPFWARLVPGSRDSFWTRRPKPRRRPDGTRAALEQSTAEPERIEADADPASAGRPDGESAREMRDRDS